jgi:ribosomal protein S12 methylthiotransferase accessory factor
MGITRVANLTGLDRIRIPVAAAFRPNARSLSVSQGKGTDLFAAKVSALMESIEAHHAERMAKPLMLLSYEDMASRYPVVNVGRLPFASPGVFHPSLPILWVEGWDLLNERAVWLPYELVHANYTHPMPTGSGCFNASTNGLASGNHRLEATAHAICEVIERDASTLWYMGTAASQGRSRVDLGTINDERCCSLLDLYDAAAVDVAVWETTSDVGVATFLCLISDRGGLDGMHSAAGMGCHPCRAVALLRALTEAAQSRLTVIAGSRDDIFREDYAVSQSPATLARDRELIRAAEGEARLRNFTDIPEFSSEDFADDLDWLLAKLHEAGIAEVVLVDLTEPQYEVPVVRVVVPGLESLGWEPGYSPGERARRQLGGTG